MVAFEHARALGKQGAGYASMTRGVRAAVRAGESIVTFSACVDLRIPTQKNRTVPIGSRGNARARAYRLPSPLVRWSVSAAGVPTSISEAPPAQPTRLTCQSQQPQRCLVALRSSRRASPWRRSSASRPSPTCSPPALGARGPWLSSAPHVGHVMSAVAYTRASSRRSWMYLRSDSRCQGSAPNDCTRAQTAFRGRQKPKAR